MTRFVNEDTVITMVETDKNDDNYSILQDNLRLLKGARLKNGKQINIIEIQMPKKVEWKGQRLPASYANFYIANEKVIVPLYDKSKDEKAMRVLQDIFSTRQVVGIDATYIIIGLGSFHCLSQQEPEVNDK
jgi:agmatine deiminase